jgi:acetoin utilization deacetylase AcuC-like enzyme
MSIGLHYHPFYLEHQTGRHPENPGRLTTAVELLKRRGAWARLTQLDAEPALREALEAVHDPRYLDLLHRGCERGGGYVTADTPFSARSYEVAALASGGAIAVAEAVLDGTVDAAFSLTRPPGHHATSEEGMGFCLFNHIAVAARDAVRRRGLERVLIVDFDVHHGNGTQDIFYEDPAVMYYSHHQYPAYPGTGAAGETGANAGVGTTVNVPLPAGVGDWGFARALEEVLVPVARRYRPELILVSAGYDAHWTNTAYLNSIRMNATVTGFGYWTRLLAELAAELCDGRIAFVLEGGYDPNALGLSIDATLRVLLGEEVQDPLGEPPSGTDEPDIRHVINECREIHGLA